MQAPQPRLPADAARLWGPPQVLAGPFTGLSLLCDSGQVQVIHLLFQPDALHRLTGVDPAALVNRVEPAGRSLRQADRRIRDDAAFWAYRLWM